MPFSCSGAGSVVGYLHATMGQRFAAIVAVAPMTAAFVKAIDDFAAQEGIDAVPFKIAVQWSQL